MTFDNNGDERSTQRSEITNSRRGFLAGSAGTVGALALGGAFATQPVFASEGTETEENDGSTPPEFPSENMFEDDIDVLNYALTLEVLEAEFYNMALETIDAEALQGTEALESFDDEISDRVYGELETIREHENVHAETLTTVITDLGGEPVEKPEFDFGGATEDPDAFLETAMALENTGVSAYNGAVAAVEDKDLVTAGASIATVEGRHASFLNLLNGESPFPRSFDRARSREEVMEIASQFIAGEMTEEGGGDETEMKGDDEETETKTDDGNNETGMHTDHNHEEKTKTEES